MIEKKVKLMLDSGAFSAWTRKISIDIEQYIDFCLENLDYFESIVNLDVIPGEMGKKTLGSDEVEDSAKEGWKNYQYMIERGIPKEKLIPVFHQGENFRWLDCMITEKIPYIGIGGTKDRNTREKIQWLDRCMNIVCDKEGYPLTKFHGFGIGSLEIILRYPFFSVDSTTWLQNSRHGIVLVPQMKKDNYVYNVLPSKVIVSSRSPATKEEGKHIDNFPPSAREKILQYFRIKGYKLGKTEIKEVSKEYKSISGEKKVGMNGKEIIEKIIEYGLSNQYVQRDEINLMYYLDLEKSFPPWPWAFKRKTRRYFNT